MGKQFADRLGWTLAALALTGCSHALPGAVRTTAGFSVQATADAVPGQVIVKFRDAASRSAVTSRLGAQKLRDVAGTGAELLHTADVAGTLAALKAEPSVQWAEPNYVMRVPTSRSKSPNLTFPRTSDDLLPKQWGMAKVEAPRAWSAATGKGVRVAVVDTGIDYTHPDFGGRVEHGKDFTGTGTDGMDALFHGTHCAGTLGAGQGNGGIVGVAPEVTLVPLKVIGPNGAGSYDTVAEAITYAADHQAAIISISLAGRNPSQVLADAVAYAAGKGCLVVAAMGNEASSEPDYPAACPGAMAVGATDDHDYLPNFENTGPYISVVAPGIEILSTMPKGRYDSFDGTSASVPFVSGIAALLKSQHPSWTGKQLRARIEQTADDRGLPGPDEYFGFGRVNAGRASSRS